MPRRRGRRVAGHQPTAAPASGGVKAGWRLALLGCEGEAAGTAAPRRSGLNALARAGRTTDGNRHADGVRSAHDRRSRSGRRGGRPAALAPGRRRSRRGLRAARVAGSRPCEARGQVGQAGAVCGQRCSAAAGPRTRRRATAPSRPSGWRSGSADPEPPGASGPGPDRSRHRAAGRTRAGRSSRAQPVECIYLCVRYTGAGRARRVGSRRVLRGRPRRRVVVPNAVARRRRPCRSGPLRGARYSIDQGEGRRGWRGRSCEAL